MRAMVLCAGFGTRLGDLTREIPKPMLPLQGQPMLAYILANLSRHGFSEIAINLHFRPELIRGHFGDGARSKVSITYVEEPQLLGTAGGVGNMGDFLRQSDPFLVHYGDVVTDQDFTAMLDFHRRRKALVTILVHQRARSNSVIELDAEGRVTGMLERPTEVQRQGVSSPWVNSGVCLCAPDFLDLIVPGVASDLPRDVFPKAIGTGRMFAFPLTGYRCAVDSPERLAEVRAAIAEGWCAVTIP